MQNSSHFVRWHRVIPWVPGILLVVVTGLLYGPSIGYELVDLDDLMYITQNQMVLQGLTGPSIRAAFTTVWQGMWAPVLWLSYMLDVEIFGRHDWGLHLTNVLLHALNAGLVYLLFWRWTRKPWRALFAAAVWAWHPLRVESVAWVAERKDVLSGLFFLLCLFAYSGAHGHGRPVPPPPARRRLLLVASVAGLSLGLMVKPMLVTTPFLLLLLDVWPLGRVRLDLRDLLSKAPRLVAEKWGFWLAAAASSFLAYFAHASAGAVQATPLLERLKMIPLHYAFYLFKTVWPRNLTPLYDPMAFARPDLLVAVLLLGGMTAWACLDARRRTQELVGWAWFLGTFVPVIGLVRFGAQSIADRFTYLPAIGLSLVLLHQWPGKKPFGSGGVRALAAGGLLFWLALATGQQLPVWRNSHALYDHVLSQSPSNSFGLYFRAMQLIRTGDPESAEKHIDRILESHPELGLFHYGKALAMIAQQRGDQALEWLAERSPAAQGSIPGYWDWHMAMASRQSGDPARALDHAMAALQRMAPNDNSRADVIWLGLAASYELGDADMALQFAHLWAPFRHKQRIQEPDLMPFHLKQWEKGLRADALDYFRRFLENDPGNVEWHNNLAWLLATAEWSPADPKDAVSLARHALQHGGPHPILLDTLAAAHANAGDFEAASARVQEALALLQPAGQDTADLYRALQTRLKAYHRQEPWRDPGAAQRLLRSYDGT